MQHDPKLDELVDIASADSFPASDAPFFMAAAGVAGAPPKDRLTVSGSRIEPSLETSPQIRRGGDRSLTGRDRRRSRSTPSRHVDADRRKT